MASGLMVVMATSLLLTTRLIKETAAKGPPMLVDSLYQKRHVVREGGNLKLTCPAASDPAPMFTWHKDGVVIGPGWDRYRIHEDVLRVKELEMEDSGVFVCRATNGFGTVDILHLLFVYGNDTVLPPEDFEEDFFGRASGHDDEPPAFENPGRMKAQVSALAGETVRLTCSLTGRPLPEIRWYRDGVELRPDDASDDDWSESKMRSSSTLQLVDVRENESGRYTCKGSNSAGSLNYTYDVSVRGKVEMGVTVHPPKNITVRWGDDAMFECYVRSTSLPYIKWYRRVEPTADVRNATSPTISLHGDRYLELGGGGEAGSLLTAPSQGGERGGGTYRSRLAVKGAKEGDAGMYVCYATGGHHWVDFRSTYLTVLPAGDSIVEAPWWSDASFLPIILAIAAVGGAFFLAIFAFVVYRACCRSQGVAKEGPPTQARPLPGAESAGGGTGVGRSPDRHQYSAIQSPTAGGSGGGGVGTLGRGGERDGIMSPVGRAAGSDHREREAMLSPMGRGSPRDPAMPPLQALGDPQAVMRALRSEQFSGGDNNSLSSDHPSVGSPLHQQSLHQQLLTQQQLQQHQQHLLQQHYYQQQQQQQLMANGGRSKFEGPAYC